MAKERQTDELVVEKILYDALYIPTGCNNEELAVPFTKSKMLIFFTNGTVLRTNDPEWSPEGMKTLEKRLSDIWANHLYNEAVDKVQKNS